MTSLRNRHSRTAPEIRLAIRQSDESVAALAAHYGLDPKTVRRWRRRSSILDYKTGPRNPRSTVLSLSAEAEAIAVRWLTELPLDDCYHLLRSFIPELTRTSLHRCFRRHAVARRPSVQGAPVGSGEFNLHLFQFLDETSVHCLFIAVERSSKYIFTELYASDGHTAVAEFLQGLARAAPVRVRTVFTDRQGQLASMKAEVTRACTAIGTAHRRVEMSWAPDQSARVHSLLVEAVRSRGVEFTAEMRSYLSQRINHYNSLCRLKALGGLTPHGYLTWATRRGLRPEKSRGGVPQSASRISASHALASCLREPERTRVAILQAARELLARVGPQGMSLSEVARIAGVNRSTTYQHFKTREQLVAATAQSSAAELREAIFGGNGPPANGVDRVQNVLAVIDRLANFAMENPKMCQAWLLQFLSSKNPANDPFWREWREAAAEFHRSALAQDGIDTEMFSLIQLAGALLWPTWARAQANGPADLQAFGRRFTRESLRAALYGAIRPEHSPELVSRLRPDHVAGPNTPSPDIVSLTAPV